MDNTRRSEPPDPTGSDRRNRAAEPRPRAIELDDEELKHVTGGQVTPICPFGGQ
jgi:bacteriocin-like protein